MRTLILAFLAVIGPAFGQGNTILVRTQPGPNWDYPLGETFLDVIHHNRMSIDPPTGHVEPQNLYGLTNSSDLARIDVMADRLRVLHPDVTGLDLYWTANTEAFQSSTSSLGTEIIHTHRDGSGIVSAPQDTYIAVDLEVTPAFELELEGLDSDRYDPELKEQREARHLVFMVDDIVFEQNIFAMVNNIEEDECLEYVKQLTGASPIPDGAGTYTIPWRNSCDPNIEWPTISAWLQDELTPLGWQVEEQIVPVLCFDPLMGGEYVNDVPQLIFTKVGEVNPDWLFIIGAHIDNGIGDGADDNASGVAAALCAAKSLASRNYEATIQVVLFQAEEEDYQGSEAYIDKIESEGNYEICGIYNLDMLGWDGDQDNIVQVQYPPPGGGISELMVDLFIDAVSTYGLLIGPRKVCDSDPSTDAGVFWQHGYAATQTGGEFFCSLPISACDWQPWCWQEDFNPNYHSGTDTWDTLDPEQIAETARAITAVIAHLAVPN